MGLSRQKKKAHKDTEADRRKVCVRLEKRTRQILRYLQSL